MLAMALALATTGGGYLLVLAIIVPVIGMLLSLVIGGRHAERIALTLMPAGLGLSFAIAIEIWVISIRRRNSRKSARRSPSGRCCRACGRR